MGGKDSNDLTQEFQELLDESIAKNDKTAQNTQIQETNKTINFFNNINTTIIVVKNTNQTIIINQNTIQSQDNLSKGQENGSNDDGKGFKHPTSTPNLTGNDAGIEKTPTIRENDELLQDDEKRQGNDGIIGEYAVGITSTPTSNGSLPQNERTPDNSRGSDTRESKSTAESKASRAESNECQEESRRSRAVVKGCERIAEIYKDEVKLNPEEIKKLEQSITYLRIKCESNEGRISTEKDYNRAIKNIIDNFKTRYTIAKIPFKETIYKEFTKTLLSMQFVCNKLYLNIKPEYKQSINNLYHNQNTKFQFR